MPGSASMSTAKGCLAASDWWWSSAEAEPWAKAGLKSRAQTSSKRTCLYISLRRSPKMTYWIVCITVEGRVWWACESFSTALSQSNCSFLWDLLTSWGPLTCTTFRFEGCIQKRYSLSRFGNEEVIANEAHGQGEVQVQSLRLVLKYHKIGSLSAEAYKRQGSYLLVFCKPSILKFQLFTQLHQLSSILLSSLLEVL